MFTETLDNVSYYTDIRAITIAKVNIAELTALTCGSIELVYSELIDIDVVSELICYVSVSR